MFTDVCPHCVSKLLSCSKPVAGIRNIVTEGFSVQGQVDLFDFQSMPDGPFKYLLNYIDHGVKKLTSIPLTSKRATSVAFALFTIFTEQGPPSILQTDNGGGFSNHAHNDVGIRMVLEDEFIDLVIKEIKNLWPQCKMVRGSPCHSESNGGVERVNRMVQKKLDGWMKTNNSCKWAIGCKISQWRINTQHHQTIKDTPYHLTYGQHPRIGISNLPVSSEILANLVTEAQLQDMYSLMNVDGVGVEVSALELDDAALPVDGLELQDEISAEAIKAVDTLVSKTPLLPKETLGKRKERSAQSSSAKTREIRDAKQAAMSKVLFLNELTTAEPSSNPINTTAGKSGNDETVRPSIQW